MDSAMHALEMMEEAFGAYRALLSDSIGKVRSAAWAEVAEVLKGFKGKEDFLAPVEVLIRTGTKPILLIGGKESLFSG
jgi:hypothetical protein